MEFHFVCFSKKWLKNYSTGGEGTYSNGVFNYSRNGFSTFLHDVEYEDGYFIIQLSNI